MKITRKEVLMKITRKEVLMKITRKEVLMKITRKEVLMKITLHPLSFILKGSDWPCIVVKLILQHY